jgi:hypothetical protein
MPLDVNLPESIHIDGSTKDWVVLWCDREIALTAFGCREKIGDQLDFVLTHTKLHDPSVKYEKTHVGNVDSDSVLRKLLLRRMGITAEDLLPNEHLYIISTNYIDTLNLRRTEVPTDVTKLNMDVIFRKIRRRRRGEEPRKRAQMSGYYE